MLTGIFIERDVFCSNCVYRRKANNMAERISIVVVDDHPLFREGVVTTLVESGLFDVVAQAGSKEEAIIQAEKHLPDLMLLDVSMPGGGIETATEISSRVPVIKIIMLTVSEQEHDVQAALKAQARGYILKGVASEDLISILQDIHNGDSYISPNLAVNLLMRSSEKPKRDSPEDFDLNDRERQILEKLAIGMSNKEIADDIYLSEKTVKHYMTNIMHKLHVSNRVQAAIKAYEMSKYPNR
ncbi:LuxR family two component transcriptional regulator [Arenicella xantha]|uniref:LuxR family two component transcriptional regulator n=2 Tax=Arenicella xantha TaxID=644221 RepID=A0A395JJC9_9GAMM|nr:LuxR family two component transcriptional regulator [Arenicella xantha]